jgi:hypothetical protein
LTGDGRSSWLTSRRLRNLGQAPPRPVTAQPVTYRSGGQLNRARQREDPRESCRDRLGCSERCRHSHWAAR